jgi:hypothetical protein
MGGEGFGTENEPIESIDDGSLVSNLTDAVNGAITGDNPMPLVGYAIGAAFLIGGTYMVVSSLWSEDTQVNCGQTPTENKTVFTKTQAVLAAIVSIFVLIVVGRSTYKWWKGDEEVCPPHVERYFKQLDDKTFEDKFPEVKQHAAKFGDLNFSSSAERVLAVAKINSFNASEKLKRRDQLTKEVKGTDKTKSEEAKKKLELMDAADKEEKDKKEQKDKKRDAEKSEFEKITDAKDKKEKIDNHEKKIAEEDAREIIKQFIEFKTEAEAQDTGAPSNKDTQKVDKTEGTTPQGNATKDVTEKDKSEPADKSKNQGAEAKDTGAPSNVGDTKKVDKTEGTPEGNATKDVSEKKQSEPAEVEKTQDAKPVPDKSKTKQSKKAKKSKKSNRAGQVEP